MHMELLGSMQGRSGAMFLREYQNEFELEI